MFHLAPTCFWRDKRETPRGVFLFIYNMQPQRWRWMDSIFSFSNGKHLFSFHLILTKNDFKKNIYLTSCMLENHNNKACCDESFAHCFNISPWQNCPENLTDPPPFDPVAQRACQLSVQNGTGKDSWRFACMACRIWVPWQRYETPVKGLDQQKCPLAWWQRDIYNIYYI